MFLEEAGEGIYECLDSFHWFKPRWFEGLNPEFIICPSMEPQMGDMNWQIVHTKKLRGSKRFWKTYEYHVTLRAMK